MKQILLLAAASLMLTALTADADDVSFKIGKASLSTRAGSTSVSEGGTYVIIPITMKNLTAKETSVGGVFTTSFKLKQGEFNFDVDGGVGWTMGNNDYSNGLAVLKPLMPQTLKVVFTVPAELSKGKFTLTLPDGTESVLK